MSYKALGKLIKKEREKRAWDQVELAKRVSREQQTVSRWEKGLSRPRRDDLRLLVSIFSADEDVWFGHAKYEIEEPDISLAPYLPIQRLTSEKFELFCKAVVQALNPKADVSLYGTRGYEQDGIDLYSKEGKKILDYQCKRHKQFGPEKIKAVVKKTTFKAKHHHILLSRDATPQAKKTIKNYRNWSLWDRQNLSDKVREVPDRGMAVRIVHTFFPDKLKSFLGEEGPGPWLTPEDYFQPFESRLSLFSHAWSLVGRQAELKKLKDFQKNSKFQAILVSGRGSVGKSRLLKAWSLDVQKKFPVRFVSTGTKIDVSELALLPKDPSFVVIDDAHEREDILVILNGVARLRPEMKVILVSRPYGVTRLEDSLIRSGMTCNFGDTVNVGDLIEKDAEQLSAEVLSSPEVNGDKVFSKRIAKITKDCPLATVVGSYLVGQGVIKPELLNNEKRFRKVLLKSFRDVVAGKIGGGNPDKIRNLLNLLAVIQPFNPDDQKFIKIAENILGEHADVLIKNISLLEDAGVLLRRGYHMRIVPDLLADYIRFEVSYDEKGTKPTGYVDRIFDKLEGDLAIHLLVNISQLDWRLTADNVQSALLDSIWKKILSEIKSSNNADRSILLKKLRDVAYYQPKKFFELVKYLKDNPSTAPEDPKLSKLYKYSNEDVLKELPEILRRLCYHLEYLPKCVDMIWQLAREDARRTNQYPEHGMRILQELAQYDVYEITGKGLGVNKLMLEAVKRWLSDPNLEDYVYSPLDVLDELLDKDSSTDTYGDGKITIRSFGVNYDATKDIRNEALPIIVNCAKSKEQKVSLRAIQSLGHALSEPRALYGRKVKEEEGMQWRPFQKKVLGEIEKIIEVHDSPIVLVKIKEILAWQAQYGKSDEIRNTSRRLYKFLSKSFGVRLVQALTHSQDRDWFINEEKYDYEVQRKKSLNFRREMVREFVKKYPKIREGTAVLGEILGRLEEHGKNPFPIIFLSELANLYPKNDKKVDKLVISDTSSVLARYFGYIIFGLIETDFKSASKLLDEALELGDDELVVSVAGYYWRGKWIDYFDEKHDISRLKKLLSVENKFSKKLSIGSLGRLAKHKPKIAKDLLLTVDLGDDGVLASEFCAQFDKKYCLDPDILTDDELEQALCKLEKVKSIDDYHVEEFINYASGRLPLVVVELLLTRVDLAGKGEGDEKYQPLPYSTRQLLKGFSKSKHYRDVLRKVRDKILGRGWQIKFWVPKLFKLISNNFDPIGLEVLLEWVESKEKSKIEGVAIIIESAPENFVFVNSEFVSKTLSVASRYGDDFVKVIKNALSHSTVFRSKHGTPGQPMPEDVELKEKSEVMLTKYPVGSLEYDLYKSLNEHAEKEIEDQLKRDQELLD